MPRKLSSSKYNQKLPTSKKKLIAFIGINNKERSFNRLLIKKYITVSIKVRTACLNAWLDF